MKPFARSQLTNERKAFNYRISRARKTVECAFGMLCSKFGVLQTSINCKVDTVDTIIQAICVLHNYIRIHDGKLVIPTIQNEALIRQNARVQPRCTAKRLRDRLCDYMQLFPIPNQYLYNV